jgi:8-oxo-dGTP pyrophosphatase MutT (NUDIX family)
VTRHGDSQAVPAAGGVLWRQGSGLTVEVALVRARRHGSWSFPRERLRPGEHPLVTACRAVNEETGIQAAAGRRLETGRRHPEAGPEDIQYWAMRAAGGQLASAGEAGLLAWAPAAGARGHLDCRTDGYAVDVLGPLPGAALAPAVLLVCTAPDAPGQQRGSDGTECPPGRDEQERARALGPVLRAFRPSELLSSRSARSAWAMRLLGAELGLNVREEPALGEGEYARHPGRGQSRILEIAGVGGGPPALCASGAVIGQLLTALSEDAELPTEQFPADCGSMYALFFLGGHLDAVDYYPASVGRHPVKNSWS